MEPTNRTMMLFLLLGFVLLLRCAAEKEVNCRKYVFAPICRGAALKRDIQKLEPLFEERRKPRYMPNDEKFSDTYRASNENTVYDKILLDTLMRKIAPKNNPDYDTGTGNY